MELGKAKLRHNGMNNLLNALHKDHGLLWTDGKGIYLVPVHLTRDQVDQAAPLRLGEFQSVQSVHWSYSSEEDGCFMVAVHQSNVSVWHVGGTVPRLAFKQVRKINVQPIPQGCLWNPKSDILCLLSRQQCSFYFRHTHNRGSFAFPSLENGRITCGCWSPDGNRLVLCVGAALLIYTWTDVVANIHDFVTTAWRVPGVSGSITAIVPASDSTMVCASDLPLDVLCANSNSDSFALPDLKTSDTGSDGIIRPCGNTSAKDTLFNLKSNSKSQVEDAAMLSVIQLKSGVHDPVLLTSAVVPALLSPDLLHFQVESQCVVVGSNTQNGLQVFALLDNQLVFAAHMTLEKEERPKGVCGVLASHSAASPGVLVLVGKSEPVDPTFPSANNTTAFSLSLKFFPTQSDKARQLVNGLVPAPKAVSSSSLTKSDRQPPPRPKSISDSRLTSSKSARSDLKQSAPLEENITSDFKTVTKNATQMSSKTSLQLETSRTVTNEVSPNMVGQNFQKLETSSNDRKLIKDKSSEHRSEFLEEENSVRDIRLSVTKADTGHSRSKLVEDLSDSPHSDVKIDSTKVSLVQALEIETVQFSQTAPSFKNTALSNKYEISSEDTNGALKSVSPKSKMELKKEQNDTDLKSGSPKSNREVKKDNDSVLENMSSKADSNSHVEVKKDKKRELLTNGHGQPDRAKFYFASDNLSSNVQNKPLAAQQAASSLMLHHVTGKGDNVSVDDGESVCSSFNSSDSNYDMLEKQIQTQKEHIDALHKRLADLSVMVEDSACVFPVRYQKITNPESVTIQCVVGGAKVSRKFLLDNGRLQLDPVKLAFGLLSVELILDGEPLVLGANIDGYIPMRFTAGSVLHITGIPMVYSPQLKPKAHKKESA